MATIRIFTCDKCKKEFKGEEEIKESGQLSITIKVITMSFHYNYKDHVAQWCKNCASEMGMFSPSYQPKDTTPPKKQSFEDLFREIVQEELEGWSSS